jgi:hypothetical protein
MMLGILSSFGILILGNFDENPMLLTQTFHFSSYGNSKFKGRLFVKDVNLLS